MKSVQRNLTYVAPSPGDIDETNPLVIPTRGVDTRKSATDNDAEAELPVAPLVSVGDYVWLDRDRDGLQDAGEPPVPGVTVRLLSADGKTVLAETKTDENGFYSFTDLYPGTKYLIEFVRPDGYEFTVRGADDAAANSDAHLITGRVAITTPTDGDNSAVTPDDPTFDAGLVTYDLTIDKQRIGAEGVPPGTQVTFKLTPTNLGPADVFAGWTVTDELPAGLTLVSMSGEGYDCEGLVCTAQQGLAAGANGPTITVVVTVDDGVEGTLTNVAIVGASPKDVPEPNLKNNRDDAPVIVPPETNPPVVPDPDPEPTPEPTPKDVPALPKTDGTFIGGVFGGIAFLAAGWVLFVARRRESRR